MKTYKLISPTDARLNEISKLIPLKAIGSERVQQIVKSMNRIALGERDAEHPELPSLVGLAAPQLGAMDRIILFDINATSGGKANFDVDLRVVINPKISSVSSEKELGREGCYSTGDIAGAVYRAKSVTISGLDELARPVSYKLEGFLARIVQHEVDHLDGIRFPDRIRKPEHLHAVDFNSKEFQDYRDNWQHWKKLYPVEDWLKIKNG